MVRGILILFDRSILILDYNFFRSSIKNYKLQQDL